MNIVAHKDTNLILASDVAALTPQSISSRIYGSKLVLLVEQLMIMTTWGCKICLLLIYYKLTLGLKQQLGVKILGGYVVVTWIVMESLYFGYWCRPFHDYWAVPTPNSKCSSHLMSIVSLTLLSPMLHSASPPNHERCLQHILRPANALHSDPHPDKIQASNR